MEASTEAKPPNACQDFQARAMQGLVTVKCEIHMIYRKTPNRSPGLIKVRKHFWWAYIWEDLYSEGLLG